MAFARFRKEILIVLWYLLPSIVVAMEESNQAGVSGAVCIREQYIARLECRKYSKSWIHIKDTLTLVNRRKKIKKVKRPRKGIPLDICDVLNTPTTANYIQKESQQNQHQFAT